MDWLNLHSKVLDSPQVVGAEPVDRGTWLMLQRYCIGQENGGRIAGCGAWKDRKWQQLAKVTLLEVQRKSELWAWDGQDLVVWEYPVEKEAEVQAKREIAKVNGNRGGRPRKTDVGFSGKPTSVIFAKAEGEGEVEGERKGSGKAATAAASEELNHAQQLCLAHPARALTAPALAAALAAVKRHDFAELLAGTVAYAAAVRGWTEAEKIQFVKNPEAFFREDTWNQPPENWRSRIAARQVNGQHVRAIDIGGRRSAGVETAHLE